MPVSKKSTKKSPVKRTVSKKSPVKRKSSSVKRKSPSKKSSVLTKKNAQILTALLGTAGVAGTAYYKRDAIKEALDKYAVEAAKDSIARGMMPERDPGHKYNPFAAYRKYQHAKDFKAAQKHFNEINANLWASQNLNSHAPDGGYQASGTFGRH